jgi:Icc-related predicted phosphoesterase
MSLCFFVTDLHGHLDRFEKLFRCIRAEKPDAVFIGGDFLPSFFDPEWTSRSFIHDFLAEECRRLAEDLQKRYPDVFIILGNDDGRRPERDLVDEDHSELWTYIHGRVADWGDYRVFGYSFIPPSPFVLKDWERYDVSRYVDPGCVSPEEGMYSVPVSEHDKKYRTIQDDLEEIRHELPLERSIGLFHVPPYKSKLDRADLDDCLIDHVPLDVHIGSIAVARFIQQHQPLITLHGHVHESTRLTGVWHETFSRTHAINAAHDGPELALVRFDPDSPAEATRELI